MTDSIRGSIGPITRTFITSTMVVGALAAWGNAAWAQRTSGDQGQVLGRTAYVRSIELQVQQKRTQCLAAIGSNTFCDCLSAALPTAVDFPEYVSIAAEQRPASTATRRAILAARDRCVDVAFRR